MKTRAKKLTLEIAARAKALAVLLQCLFYLPMFIAAIVSAWGYIPTSVVFPQRELWRADVLRDVTAWGLASVLARFAFFWTGSLLIVLLPVGDLWRSPALRNRWQIVFFPVRCLRQ